AYILSSSAAVLTGTVTNIDSGDPVDSALVQIYNDVNELAGENWSDENGVYHVNDLDNGVYNAVVTAELYLQLTADEITVLLPDTNTYNFQLTPYYESDIETIQTIHETGDWVLTSGIVTQPTNTVSFENTDYYIQDATGYGVRIYSVDPWIIYDDALRGDEISLLARIDEIDGVTQLTEFMHFEWLSYDNELPEPITGSTGEIAENFAMEGSWAHLAGYLLDDPPDEGDYTVRLDDSSGALNIYISDDTGIDLTEFGEGDWLIVEGVISVMNEEVCIIPSLEEDVYQNPMYAPYDLRGTLTDEIFGEVTLSWEHDVLGEGEELIYDNDTYTGTFYWIGNTPSVRFSPDDPCQLLALRFLIDAINIGGRFNAVVYDWDEDAPDTEFSWSFPQTGIERGLHWYIVDLNRENIYYDEDFVAGFGSLDDITRLAYDSNLNNHRSWDFNGEEWTAWTEAYLIRAVVLYGAEEIVELHPETSNSELDEFLEFIIYRDNVEIARTSSREYIETLPDTGFYSYRVSAYYNEGETALAGPVTIDWHLENAPDEAENNIPKSWNVYQPYPNPFNSEVHVTVDIPYQTSLNITVMDILGREVALLQEGNMIPGTHNFQWSAYQDASGIYFIRVSSGTGFSDVRKILLLR
ncbi:carboxypeptidase regulatory-like domain-containing protein, partial [Calditrichota bacterium]